MSKRLLALLAGLLLATAVPGTAGAGRATRFTDHSINLFCEGLSATSGGGFAFFGASVSDSFGPDAFVDFWAGAEPIGPPDLGRDFDQTVTVSWNGTTLQGSIPLRDAAGDAAGSATFSATLTPTGDPFVLDDRHRDGNRWHDVSGTSQPMQPVGTLAIGGSTFSLDTCFADESTISVFETNPRAFVGHFADRGVGCDLANTAGDTGFLFTSLQEGNVFIDAAAFPADGSAGTGAGGEGTVIDGVLDATLALYSFETGEPVADSGSIHLEIVGGGEPFEFVLRNATGTFKVEGSVLDLEGTLTIGSMIFDLGSCVGTDAELKIIDTFPNGPKPGGKVPSNDLPENAKLLSIGSRTSVATKGASPEREAGYECLSFDFDGDVFEVPVGHTVWYRIVGTGDPITVDTAGSDYDTVVAVYTADGAGGYDPVPDACVDDVPIEPFGRTLQAAVSWDSVEGTSYYVQIGGFPESFPYGNLRVSVR